MRLALMLMATIGCGVRAQEEPKAVRLELKAGGSLHGRLVKFADRTYRVRGFDGSEREVREGEVVRAAFPETGFTARWLLAQEVAQARREKSLERLLAPRKVEVSRESGPTWTLRISGHARSEEELELAVERPEDRPGGGVVTRYTIDREGRIARWTMAHLSDPASQYVVQLEKDRLLFPGAEPEKDPDRPSHPWSPEHLPLDVCLFLLLPALGPEVPPDLTLFLGGLTGLGDVRLSSPEVELTVKLGEGKPPALELWGDLVVPTLTIGRDGQGRPTSLRRATRPQAITLRWLPAAESEAPR